MTRRFIPTLAALGIGIALGYIAAATDVCRKSLASPPVAIQQAPTNGSKGLVVAQVHPQKPSDPKPSSPARDVGSEAWAKVLAKVTVRPPDAFYRPPTEVPNKPGVLLRSEKLKDVTLPEGMQGWRILYTTAVNDTTPATAVATIFAPTPMPAGPRPVITWEHGTTGLYQKCMPSLFSMPLAGMPSTQFIAKQGWVIVATDYQFTETDGPHPYLIGDAEGRAGLDSVRAAHQMRELTLDQRTVVWGHSQGGQSALWTGIIGPKYAPEIKIVGVAAMAPAANPANMLAKNPMVDKWLGDYIAMAYSRFYPDIKFEQAVRPEALKAAREMVNLCIFFPRSDPERAKALAETFEGRTLSTDATLAARLKENTADRPIAAPLLVVQGLDDVLILPPVTDEYVKERAASGQQVEYWTIPGRGHGGIVEPGSPLEKPLVEWTTARFANQPVPPGCNRKTIGSAEDAKK